MSNIPLDPTWKLGTIAYFYCFVVQSSGTGAHAVPVEAEMHRPALCLGEEVERQTAISVSREGPGLCFFWV